MSTKKKLKNIGIQINQTLEELQSVQHMVRGTYCNNYRRCGKVNCWCHKEEVGHPNHRITWSKNAKSESRVVPKEDVEWIKDMTQNYREYRQLRKKLRLKTNEFKKVLDLLEEEIIVKTKKKRDYL